MDGVSDAYSRGKGGSSDRNRSYRSNGGYNGSRAGDSRPYGRGGHGSSYNYSHGHGRPYERNDRDRGNNTSSFHRSGPKKLEEVFATDELLSTDQFQRYNEVASTPGVTDYAQYLSVHRRAALMRFFESHKTEAWLQEQFDAFKAADYTESMKAKYFALSTSFKERLEQGHFSGIRLEDGEDLKVEGDKPSENASVRSFPIAMSLPDRISPAVHQRGIILSLSNIGPAISIEELKTMLNEVSDGKLIDLELSFPMAEKGYCRLGWATFESEIDLASIIPKVEEKILHGDKIYCSSQKLFSLQIKLADPAFSLPERIAKDTELAAKLVAVLDERCGLESWIALAIADKPEVGQLDLLLCYLRLVHSTCFYSGVVAAGPCDLIRQCGDLYLRSQLDHVDSLSAPMDWFESLHEDLRVRLNIKFEPVNDDHLLEKHIAKVDEGRFRCTLCAKLFKGPDFVIKHLRVKHEDVSKVAIMETATLNNLLQRPPSLPAALLPLPVRRRRSSASSATGAPDRNHRQGHRGYDRDRRDYRDKRHQSARLPMRRDPPPPPEGAVQDPRKLRQYRDWDAPSAGDVEINYD